ncbi:MAG: DUF58 domain-containing protein [Lentisphaeria bacterium]|nr:DUF58 domain-containing protein [Lentisphaeria bacterium]
MSRNPLRLIGDLWRRFLDGPQWLRESHGLGFVFQYYRSPSLKLLFWAMAWYERLFSRPMRLLFIVIPMFAFFSMFTLNSLAVTMFLFLLSLLAVDLVVGLVFRPRLSVERDMPPRVKCGTAFDVSYRVRNLRRLPAADLLLDPNIELPELRRVQGFKYVAVRGHAEERFATELKPFKRGVFSIPQGIAESGFPFNLFKHSVLFGRKESLIVHPASRELKNLFPRDGGVLPRLSARSVPRPGDSMDFYGCRTYRPGDSPRKIHWRATARYRLPIIKEYQQEHVSHAAVLLDTYVPRARLAVGVLRALFSLSESLLRVRTNLTFEAAVSLAASIAETLTSASYHVDLLAVGGRITRFPTNGEPDRNCDPLLDELATATTSARDAFAGKGAAALAEDALESGTVFVILTRWDAASKAFLASLTGRGSQIVPVLVAERVPDTELPDDLRVITPDAVLKGGDLPL